MKPGLRFTGVAATLVFLTMVVSDLLMLTTLDFGVSTVLLWNRDE
jgi:hypothetical protein